MPNPLIAVAGIGAGSSVIAANSQKKAAASAAAAQTAAADAGIAEQQRQFDKVQELLNPFVEGGTDAFSQMLTLGGANGAAGQASAIEAIANGSEMAAMVGQGENAILQNASATGGLRGGNTQGALAQYRPQVLNQLVNQQYSRLGGLATMGQNSAAMVGTAGQSMANNVSNLYQQQGAAQAGSALASGAATAQAIGGIGQSIGNVLSYTPPMPQGSTIFSQWGF